MNKTYMYSVDGKWYELTASAYAVCMKTFGHHGVVSASEGDMAERELSLIVSQNRIADEKSRDQSVQSYVKTIGLTPEQKVGLNNIWNWCKEHGDIKPCFLDDITDMSLPFEFHDYTVNRGLDAWRKNNPGKEPPMTEFSKIIPKDTDDGFITPSECEIRIAEMIGVSKTEVYCAMTK